MLLDSEQALVLRLTPLWQFALDPFIQNLQLAQIRGTLILQCAWTDGAVL
jgi:hypothetical protein